MGNSKEKPTGWFSRRHQTREAQEKAREAHENRAFFRPTQYWNDDQKEWVKVL